MALPESRDETLVDAGPFPFTLGNNLQDQIISGLHGQVIRQQGGAQIEGTTDVASADNWNKVTAPGAAISVVGGSSVIGTFSADFPVGTVIRQVDLYLFTDTGAGGRVVVIELFDMDPTADSAMVAVSSGGWATDTSDGIASTFDLLTISGGDLALTAIRRFALRVTANNNIRILQANWTIAKLT